MKALALKDHLQLSTSLTFSPCSWRSADARWTLWNLFYGVPRFSFCKLMGVGYAYNKGHKIWMHTFMLNELTDEFTSVLLTRSRYMLLSAFPLPSCPVLCSGHRAPKKSPCTDFCHCRFALLIFKLNELNVSGFMQSVFIVRWILWFVAGVHLFTYIKQCVVARRAGGFCFFVFTAGQSSTIYAYLWNCFGVYPRKHPTPCTLLLTVWKECGPPEDTRPLQDAGSS